ncbi:unnamed protein product [Moneuplotes crassus]|uniref:BZIP domain-containing protein n=1 Tax=Euplotes crassus TaxID=5936 RepID=A0AAD1UR84_EUPCR|nr:unnamed protein product [Moneuplotes crassus]
MSTKKRERKMNKKKDTLSLKERSKIHRERKKKYYQDLEEKVKILEEENRKLKAKIIFLSQQAPARIEELEVLESKDKNNEADVSLNREENFVHQILPDMIKKKPHDFRMSLFENLRDNQGAYGSERIKLLKNSFSKIIECCVPMTFKLLLCAFTYTGGPKLITILRDKRKNNRSSYKYYKSTVDVKSKEEKKADPSSAELPPHLLSYCNKGLIHELPEHLAKLNTRVRIEEAFYRYPFSQGVIDCWSKNGIPTRDYLFEIRDCIQDLVKIRNKMLNCLKNLHNEFFTSGMYKSFTKDDIVAFSKMGAELKGSDLVDPFTLYQLRRREEEEDVYQDDEISWFDS